MREKDGMVRRIRKGKQREGMIHGSLWFGMSKGTLT